MCASSRLFFSRFRRPKAFNGARLKPSIVPQPPVLLKFPGDSKPRSRVHYREQCWPVGYIYSTPMMQAFFFLLLNSSHSSGKHHRFVVDRIYSVTVGENMRPWYCVVCKWSGTTHHSSPLYGNLEFRCMYWYHFAFLFFFARLEALFSLA